ncbi:MAG: hypothetical protein HYV65_00430 [Candidatus Spechtbacteria bacterium]|nr:hypothetical protein [Candidatus Spechtbacteria bacterium]
MFRFAAGGVGGAANKNDRKFLGFAPRELVERGRGASVIRQNPADFVRNPIFTFCEIVRNSLGAKRLCMVFFRNFKGIFEIARQRAVGNAEVRSAKLWQNEILQTNLFSFAFSERLSVFFLDCPKNNLKPIWTT